MKKNSMAKLSITLIFVLFALLCFSGSAANPGTEEDPLVSLSYVNEVLMPQIKSYVDSQMQQEPSGNTFQIVNVKKGQTIIGFQGTEMILRMGSAKVVATQKGGIADVTTGTDLQMGAAMPANHLLIVPYTDWRGVTMQTDGIVLVKGMYSIN
ncbi:MAG: hypothetical protein IKJ68_05720 [Clostridia bacterium]|nr:hypothetical protein [Clostridia bacterium]